jgi:hypothetical protein
MAKTTIDVSPQTRAAFEAMRTETPGLILRGCLKSFQLMNIMS